MKTIFKIARLELKTLFSSPIAWLLLIILTVQISLDFIEMLKVVIIHESYPFGWRMMGEALIRSHATELIFGKYFYFASDGILMKTISHWYLYIPLLTMGLISRELSSGNIKLLFSSPIKTREIVWGKFTGIMMYWSTLMLVLLVLGLCGYIFVTDLDIPMVLTCLLGVFLVAMLYSAIGLFVSCLTTYQIVAAISTFIVLGLLDYFGGLWQGINFLRDVSYFINTTAHTENLLKGLIVSEDVIYFIVLTLMFIALSVMVLQDKVHARPVMVKVGRYILLLVITLMVGYVTSRPTLTLYYDATAFKTNTITKAGQQVLGRIKGPVKITIFDNLLMNYKDVGRPDHVNGNLKTWEPYRRFLPGLEIEYVHFYDKQAIDGSYPGGTEMSLKEAAKASAKEQKLDYEDYMPPESIHKLVNLAPYNNGTIMRIENNGKSIFIRRLTELNFERFEEYVIANFKRMLDGADTLAFLAGNSERSIENEGERDYKYIMFDHTSTESLNDNGFEAIAHKPEQPIPGNVSTLVIADPASAYSPEALKNIRNYIGSGRNLLILKGENDPAVLEQLTKPWGVEFMPGMVIQPNKDRSENHIVVKLIRSALNDTSYFREGWNVVGLTNVTALKYQEGGPFEIKPVLVTDPKTTWNKMQESTLDTGKLAFHPEQGDIQIELPVALALTRQINNKEQRIMIIGNAELMTYAKTAPFYKTLFRWLSYGKFPLDPLREDSVENHAKLSYKQSDLLKYLLILVIPGILLVFGWIYILKRRSL
ncbi:Gldg family protein [Pedobacter hiemivivus]|uniref:Uncharacterized protein n=1 Tax=Pedobacter hiemivivus TaxID=2530454 RepID=A0A4R0NKL4_9SPHI|nr:Gldg family protein [Pedobacter hiemivivus]TCC99504.1 hypothetical protein EZ444_02180 [Pedobacter hiemivivus]